MEISTEELRGLFPELTDEQINQRREAKRHEDERNARIVEADRLIQSLTDQLRAAQEARDQLNAQG